MITGVLALSFGSLTIKAPEGPMVPTFLAALPRMPGLGLSAVEAAAVGAAAVGAAAVGAAAVGAAAVSTLGALGDALAV